jgi:uncharacterized protein (DUF1778 family)
MSSTVTPWATVLIPTRDSAGWIGTLLDHYRARGVQPVLLVDARSRDATRAIAARAGVATQDVSGFTITEAVVCMAKDVASTQWVLWVHDDEVPSDAVFARLAGPPPPEAATSIAMQRRWAWYEPGKNLHYGRSDQWQDRTHQPGTDHHWRLFQREAVRYVPAMHSEGFYIESWARLPPDCYLVHFEWVLRTRNQRAAKMAYYDSLREGYGRFFEKMNVPEDQAPGVIEYLPFETTAFDTLAAAYYASRKPDVAAPRRMLRRWMARVAQPFRRSADLSPFMVEPPDRAGLTPRLEAEIRL